MLLPNPATPPPPSRSCIPSPLTTQLPSLTPAQRAALPYPPDLYPGARDVSTLYGSMRVYEWGPEDGRKVMLVHGDATCAPLWKDVAGRLVERGCRAIVIDLWGRGYSDTPLQAHTPALLSLQLLFAASSSPLPWCAEGFTIVGFSLGGGIAMDFAASFPWLVRSVCLLAPAGLLRSLPQTYLDLKEAVREERSEEEVRRLMAKAQDVEFSMLGDEQSGGAYMEKELGRREDGAEVDLQAMVQWQYSCHQGHAASFASTLLYGPVMGQEESWREACKVLKHKHAARQDGRDTLVVVCADEDGVVPAGHVREDLNQHLHKQDFRFETVPGGHGFPLREGEKIADILSRAWKF